ncbi:MAG: hypothetical protein RBU25_14345, partial [Lentisphaeria bacterium]|nr:hypothetical protein [Lentisphaeria bacterium]
MMSFLLRLYVIALLIPFLSMSGPGQKMTVGPHSVAVVDHSGEVWYVRRTVSFGDKQYALPPTPLGLLTRIAHMEGIPEYDEQLTKHPELAQRQRELEERFGPRVDISVSEPQPIWQLIDRWIGGWYGCEHYN